MEHTFYSDMVHRPGAYMVHTFYTDIEHIHGAYTVHTFYTDLVQRRIRCLHGTYILHRHGT